jgi:hypothetical protein
VAFFLFYGDKMPSLFIANTSTKHNEFLFRLPGVDQLRRVNIPAGRQMEVLRNASQEEVDAVINQHAAYGLVHESQVKNADKFTGMLYQIDKPVSISAMELTVEKNKDVLLEQGHEIRKIAAVAIDDSLRKLSVENKLSEIQATEIEVVEIPDETSEKRKMMQEKIHVRKKG